MSFLVPIYQTKRGAYLTWTSLGPFTVTHEGRNPAKLRQQVLQDLQAQMGEAPAAVAARLCAMRSVRLVRVRLELTLRGRERRQVSGRYPVIVESRWANERDRLHVCYHPRRPTEWIAVEDEAEIEDQLRLYYREVWKDLEAWELAALESDGRDLLKVVAFDGTPRALSEDLPDEVRGVFDDLRTDRARGAGPRALQVLPKIGVDLTPQAVEADFSTGRPRRPYRAQLSTLVGRQPRSVVLVGPPGCGKTTLWHRLIADLLDVDDYPSHRNLDRVRHVWRISGKRLIAGMSHVGDWEERCGGLLEDLQQRRILLLVEDIHAFGRIGRARDSERSIADYFRGPVARGEVVFLAESTPEAFGKLEQDAPAFAAQFVRVDVLPTTPEETYRLMFHEARALEVADRVRFDVRTYAAVAELTDALFPSAAFPGKALEVLRALARAAGPGGEVTERSALEHLSGRTGIPQDLLHPTDPVDGPALEARFARRVMGQPAAVAAAVDLALRVREGLTDPGRPYGVLLFTGPTGTGKTELAKAMAEHLYGGASRLVRVDMSEVSGLDGPARLMGDRFDPDGLLTAPVRAQPFCVVLLDEIEKAHPSVLNLLLQLFDEGRLTDAAGRVSDFRRAVVVMTSNLGARARPAMGFGDDEAARQADIAQAVRSFFPPELFNRIDRVVPFEGLSAATARQVAGKAVGELVGRRGLTARNVFVDTTRQVLDQVVEQGFDARQGARTVKRYLEDHLGTLLTEVLTKGRPAQMRALRVYSAQGRFHVHDEALVEAEPWPVRLTVEDPDALPRAQLIEAVEAARRDLAARVERGDLQGLRDAISSRLSRHAAGRTPDDLHLLEALQNQVLQRTAEASVEAAEEEDDRWDEYQDWDGGGALPVRFGARRAAPARSPDQPALDLATASVDALVGELAQCAHLVRELAHVEDVERHRCRVEILRVGPATAPRRAEGSLVEMMSFVCLRGEITGAAVRFADGSVEASPRSLPKKAAQAPVHIVMDLVGLGVADRLRFEAGTHALVSLAEGTELCTVRVRAPDARAPSQVLEDHAAARARFERALEAGTTPLPDNPNALAPMVRRVRYAPSDEPSVPPAYAVEDYRVGHAYTRRAAALDLALRPLMHAILLRDEGER